MTRAPRLLAIALLTLTASIPLGARSAGPPDRTSAPGPVVEATEAPSAGLGRQARIAVAEAAASSSRPFATAVEEGLRLESATRVTLDPAATAVHVVYEATLTNQAG